MAQTIATFGVAALAAFLLGAASAEATRALWRGRRYLAPAYAVGGFAIVSFLTFLAYWVAPVAGQVWSFGALILALIYLIVRRAWRAWRVALVLTLFTGGILVAYVGLLFLWVSPESDLFFQAARRFSHPLPIDNYIPTFFAERMSSGSSTAGIVLDWNGSDRPPLQAGFLLLVRPLLFPTFGLGYGFAASVVAQMLWIPALYSCLRALGMRITQTYVVILFVALTGTTLINTVFTWPKMLSAALVLASVALLVDARRHPRRFAVGFVAAVVFFALAMLAHGVAAFTAPLVVAAGVVAYRRQSRGSIIRTTGIGIVAGLVTYLPWAIFQRFVDPPGDRLLKWHLAGEREHDPRGFIDVLADAYSHLSLGDWVAARVANLGSVFGGPLAGPVGGPTCECGTLLELRRWSEYWVTTSAIGVALPLVLAVLVILLARRFRGARLRLGDRQFLWLTGGALASILFWCVVMFIPGSTVVHQGSQVWIMLLLAAPIAWLWERARAGAIIAVAVQGILAALLYIPSLDSGVLRPEFLAVLLLGIAAVAGAVLLVHRHQRALVRSV
jgi:hypothetical protein